jgi:DNA-binding NtrC family response regulator
VRQTIAILGRSDIDILVEGESGTGKELVAA